SAPGVETMSYPAGAVTTSSARARTSTAPMMPPPPGAVPGKTAASTPRRRRAANSASPGSAEQRVDERTAVPLGCGRRRGRHVGSDSRQRCRAGTTLGVPVVLLLDQLEAIGAVEKE